MSRPAPIRQQVSSTDPVSPLLNVGDLVRTGVSLFPQYQVIAVNGGRGWVRDVQYGTDHVLPLGHFHKV